MAEPGTPRAKDAPSPPPPLAPIQEQSFKREVKLCKKRGKSMNKLRDIIESLCNHEILDPKHRDHQLGGRWKDYRDCHIEPDWVLIYKKTAKHLVLARTGTHADLFGKQR